MGIRVPGFCNDCRLRHLLWYCIALAVLGPLVGWLVTLRIRRTGKSHAIHQAFKLQPFEYANSEEYYLVHIAPKDLDDHVKWSFGLDASKLYAFDPSFGKNVTATHISQTSADRPFPLQAYDKPEYVGGVSFVFLTYVGMTNPEIWAWWIEEAGNWGERHFPQQTKNFGRTAVVDAVVHYKKRGHQDQGELQKLFPNNFRPVNNPADCKWGETVPCMRRALEEALQNQHSRFFIFVSHTTIPLKLFSYIYSDLARNPRSRFFFSNLNFKPFPKHHQWTVLTRDHAQILVQSKYWPGGWWNNKKPDGPPLFAADDEYRAFGVLVSTLGEKEAYRQVNNGHMFSASAKDLQKKTLPMAALNQTTFLSWNWKWCNSASVDRIPPYLPCTFISMTPTTIEGLLRSAHWMMRKVEANGLVKSRRSGTETTLADYLRAKFAANNTCEACDMRWEEAQKIPRIRTGAERKIWRDKNPH